MWQQTQSEKREQLFPPGSAWKKALTPPSREATAKKTEANHLLRMQVGLCVLLVGAVLLLCQSYAASSGVDGVLRWYLPAAAFGAAFGVQAVLDVPLGRLRQWAVFPLVRCSGALAARRKSRKAARKAAKERRNEKRLAKKLQKSLPRERRLLYNSNVSK